MTPLKDAPEDRETSPSAVERALGLFTEVRPGEGPTGILLLLNIFLVMASFYLVKPLRDGWLAVSDFQGLSKIEIKAYSSFAQSLFLLAIIPLYARLATHLRRRTLITGSTAFFIANLVLFWILQPGRFIEWRHAGILFYPWAGLFSVTVVAQFWSFAADLYSVKRGNRLLPMIAIGATAGAAVGSWVAHSLIHANVIDSYDLLLLATVPLAIGTGVTTIVDRRGQTGRGRFPERRSGPAAPRETGAYELIFGSRYLLLAAGLTLFINWVNTNGENILFGVIQEVIARDLVESNLTDPKLLADEIKTRTTSFYSDLYFWVNMCSLLIQAFLASRVVKYGGFAAILFLTPIVAILSYGLMALFPALAVIRVMKIAENSANYSANNTARQLMWLPTSATMIYKAKVAIDTVFVRVGDGLAAATILVSTRVLALGVKELLVFNVVLVLVWGAVALILVRENRRLVLQALALPRNDAAPVPPSIWSKP